MMPCAAWLLVVSPWSQALRASPVRPLRRRVASSLSAAAATSSGEVVDGRRFVVCASEDEVAQAVVDRVASVSAASIAAKGSFSLSLGSRSTVAPLRGASGVDWSKTHVFFGNERTEGEAASKCFEGAAFLQDYGATLHGVPKDDPDLAAAEYGWELRASEFVEQQTGGGGLPRLDLVLLGSGADGHCASLYPNSQQLESDDVCAAAEGKGGVTFTPKMIASAKNVVLVAAKPSQAAMVKRALAAPPDPSLPAGLPRGPNVEWILSEASAAAILDGSPESTKALLKVSEVKDVVVVGSKDYYEGFLTTPIEDFDADRDPNGGLDQALKLGGGATVVLGALFLGFMASNGLL